jgi:hypothetical protein
MRVAPFSTRMRFWRDTGDVLGDEIKIVYTREGYQGALQFAEGEPQELILVDTRVDGMNISFSIPDSSSYAGQFSGKIENGAFKGEFHFKGGGVDKVVLKKGKSYWD